MNYFINTQGSLIFFIESLIVIIILATLFTISVLAIKYFHLSEKVIKILLVIIIPLILFFSFTNKILDPYHQGVVRELFIFNDNNQTLLSVWLTRTHTKRFAADYNQRIQTFDIESGLSLGAMEIAKKHYSNDYRLYWNGENEAWGYQPKTNEQENQIHAINLAKPELVSTQDALPQPEPTIKEGWPLRIDYLDRPGWKFQFVSENI
ncbi:MAG: hypothetical protein HQ538_05260, partial [Parcubacteria group bacterium]|nr:hypothetical protein [Parcubacteria group bacterium]